jgi:hypothetical protein
VQAGDLHREIGGRFDADHRMSICCEAMRQTMRGSDCILAMPANKDGANLIVMPSRVRRREMREATEAGTKKRFPGPRKPIKVDGCPFGRLGVISALLGCARGRFGGLHRLDPSLVVSFSLPSSF